MTEPSAIINLESMSKYLFDLIVRIALVFFISVPLLCTGQSAKHYYKLATKANDSLQYEKAVLLLDSAIFLKPKYKKALLTRGEIAYQHGNYIEALTDFETVLELNSMNLSVRILTLKTLIKLEKYEDAIQHINYCISKDPSFAEPHMYRGDIYFIEGNCESAAVKYVVAQKKFKRLDGILLRKARVYAMMGKMCLALKYYNLAVDKHQDDVDLIFERAEFILFYQGIKDSKAEFKKVLSMDSSNYNAAINAGIGSLFEHKFEDANSFFSLAIKINSTAYKAYYQRAFCNFKSGADQHVVLQDLYKVLVIFPNYAPAKEMISFIEDGTFTEYSKLIISVREVAYGFDEFSQSGRPDSFSFLEGCKSGFNTTTHGTTALHTWSTWDEE